MDAEDPNVEEREYDNFFKTFRKDFENFNEKEILKSLNIILQITKNTNLQFFESFKNHQIHLILLHLTEKMNQQPIRVMSLCAINMFSKFFDQKFVHLFIGENLLGLLTELLDEPIMVPNVFKIFSNICQLSIEVHKFIIQIVPLQKVFSLISSSSQNFSDQIVHKHMRICSKYIQKVSSKYLLSNCIPFLFEGLSMIISQFPIDQMLDFSGVFLSIVPYTQFSAFVFLMEFYKLPEKFVDILRHNFHQLSLNQEFYSVIILILSDYYFQCSHDKLHIEYDLFINLFNFDNTQCVRMSTLYLIGNLFDSHPESIDPFVSRGILDSFSQEFTSGKCYMKSELSMCLSHLIVNCSSELRLFVHSLGIMEPFIDAALASSTVECVHLRALLLVLESIECAFGKQTAVQQLLDLGGSATLIALSESSPCDESALAIIRELEAYVQFE